MKSLCSYLLTLVVLFSTPISAQYLDLTGINDSNNNTHLFYTYVYSIWKNAEYNIFSNIYHYNDSTGKEILVKENISYTGFYHVHHNAGTSDIEFINNNPNEFYLGSYHLYYQSSGPSDSYCSIYKDSTEVFHAQDAIFPNIPNIECSAQNPNLVYISSYGGFSLTDKVPSSKQQYLFKSTDGGKSWNYLITGFTLASVNKNNDSILIGTKNNKLVITTCDTSLEYKDVDSVFSWTQYQDFQLSSPFNPKLRFYYSTDKKHIYTTVYKMQKVSPRFTYYLVMSDDNGYTWRKIAEKEDTDIFITLDKTHPCEIYYASGKTIYYSSDFGKVFAEFRTMTDDITGIFKKDNSEIFFVQTWKGIYKTTKSTSEKLNTIYMVDVKNESTAAPASFSLNQNYPNPFNPSTVINYQIGESGFASIKVYNTLGQEVATLLNEVKQPGSYSVEFNGKYLPNGIYFYRLTSGNSSIDRKMCLIK